MLRQRQGLFSFFGNSDVTYATFFCRHYTSLSIYSSKQSGYEPQIRACLELHSRAAPSVEAHHPSVGPDIGRNSRGKWIKKIIK